MSNNVPDFLAPPADAPTREQQRSLAQLALNNATAALAEVKKSVEGAQQAKAAAQAILDAAKPNIMLAEAAVMAAKAHLMAFGPVKSEGTTGPGPKFEDVLAVLRESPKQMTNADIVAALAEKGINTSENNIKAYTARWSQTGSIVKAEKANRLEPARYYAPPVANGAPAPSQPWQAPPAPTNIFPEDFPGREPLEAAGYTGPQDLAGKTLEDLTAIAGIGEKTANKILAAV